MKCLLFQLSLTQYHNQNQLNSILQSEPNKPKRRSLLISGRFRSASISVFRKLHSETFQDLQSDLQHVNKRKALRSRLLSKVDFTYQAINLTEKSNCWEKVVSRGDADFWSNTKTSNSVFQTKVMPVYRKGRTNTGSDHTLYYCQQTFEMSIH